MKIKGAIILFLLLVVACDTKNNVESPYDKYFLKYYGDRGDQEGVDMVLGDDGSIYLFGNSMSTDGNQQFYLVKTNELGITLWEKIYGGNTKEEAKDIEITSDGNLVIVGNVEVGPNDRDILIMTISSADGSVINSLTYVFNGVSGFDEDVNSISETTDGFIITGTSTNVESGGGQRDIIFPRFYNNLQEYSNIWNNHYHQGSIDIGVEVLEVSGGEFYVFGYTNVTNIGDAVNDFNFWTFVLGSTGVPKNSNVIAGVGSNDEILTSVISSPSQSGTGYLMCGITRSSGPSDILITKVGTDLETDNVVQLGPKSLLLNSSSPNVKTFAAALSSSGFLVLSSENQGGNTDDNFYLSKLNFQLNPAWENNLMFGGLGNDFPGAVAESADGRILLMGTIVLGEVNGQKKMALIKLNKEGEFAE